MPRSRRPNRFGLAVSSLIGLALCGCAALGIGSPDPAQRAQYLEPMLSAAGFRIVPANDPDQAQHLKSLPPLKLNYYIGKNGRMRYWFADPDFCHCLYLGDEKNYQQYQNLRVQARIARQEQEAAEENYEASQDMQMNMMNPFFGGFGPGIGFGF
jgi:hypothetical protein